MKTNIVAINEKIDRVEASEKILKADLADLSRDTLEYWKETGDVQPINRLMSVLTPVNQKTAMIFFKHFIPHVHVTNEAGEFEKFGKTDKKSFEEKSGLIREFLEDPHNTIWTWAARNIEVEQKPYDVTRVTKTIEQAIKKAGKGATIKAVLAAGLTLEDVLEVLGMEVANIEEANEE